MHIITISENGGQKFEGEWGGFWREEMEGRVIITKINFKERKITNMSHRKYYSVLINVFIHISIYRINSTYKWNKREKQRKHQNKWITHSIIEFDEDFLAMAP